MFHVKDGLFFERCKNGDVKLKKCVDAHVNAEVVIEVIIEKSMWESVISTVSKSGETTEKWNEAIKFHSN